MTDSELTWISNSKIILTINNEFYLLNVQHDDWMKVQKKVLYGRQHINMGLYVSILRTPQQSLTRSITEKDKNKMKKHTSGHVDLIKSHLSIQRMNIANFSRYAFI